MQGANCRIITKEQTSFTELLDNREGIILDLENLHYFTLNGSAVLIWKLLRNGNCMTADRITATLAACFDQRPSAEEINTFLDRLKDEGLIEFDAPVDPGHEKMTAFPDAASLPAYEAPHLKVSESLMNVTLSGSSTIATAAIATGGSG